MVSNGQNQSTQENIKYYRNRSMTEKQAWKKLNEAMEENFKYFEEVITHVKQLKVKKGTYCLHERSKLKYFTMYVWCLLNSF